MCNDAAGSRPPLLIGLTPNSVPSAVITGGYNPFCLISLSCTLLVVAFSFHPSSCVQSSQLYCLTMYDVVTTGNLWPSEKQATCCGSAELDAL